MKLLCLRLNFYNVNYFEYVIMSRGRNLQYTFTKSVDVSILAKLDVTSITVLHVVPPLTPIWASGGQTSWIIDGGTGGALHAVKRGMQAERPAA